jgi:hypothetical protein
MGRLMRRHAKRAIMVRLTLRVEVRSLHHPAHQDKCNAKNAEHRSPAQPRSGENAAHATASTITGHAREPQTFAAQTRQRGSFWNSPRFLP